MWRDRRHGILDEKEVRYARGEVGGGEGGVVPEGRKLMNEWSQQVLVPILQGEQPALEKIQQLGDLALLSADTDKIKEYVFESARLPEIRGASVILDNLNQGWPGDGSPNIREIFATRGLPIGRKGNNKAPSCIIYAGGGSLLALVPVDLAEGLKSEIEALYSRETGAATITCVWQPVDAEQVQGHLDDLMARQSLLLRRAKQEKDPLPFFEAIPPVRRCDSCGIRPAAEVETEPELRWLCRPCKKKIEKSRPGKNLWTREFLDELLAGRLDCEPSTYLAGSDPAELDSVQGARDLEEIAQASQDKKSIGFIYADGNGVGRLVEESKTIEEYRRKSDILHKAIRQAVFTALGHHLRIARDIQREVAKGKYEEIEAIHPFEIITIGGDDALLIVPGDRALDVAIALGRTFEAELSKYEEFVSSRATLSVGLVIADRRNPVYFLYSLAEELLKSAKRRDRKLAREDQTPAEGTLDFLVLKSQTMLSTDLSDLRSHFPWTVTAEPQREKAILTGRPFTWTEAERLKRTAQAVKRGLPRSQIQALRQALRQGRLAGSLFYLYQWARADKRRKALLWWVEQAWGMQATQASPPWLKLEPDARYERYGTVWEDIAEVMELVSPLSNEEWEKFREQIQQEKAR